MGHKTGSWNRHGPISNSPHGKIDHELSDAEVAEQMDISDIDALQDPLDHDGDGKMAAPRRGPNPPVPREPQRRRPRSQ
jgi:hypothetical protein